MALASLAACGGGGGGGGGGFLPITGGGNGAGTGTEVSGTAARGAMLVGATVSMTCANGATVAGSTNGLGVFTTNKVALTYPCVGKATLGNLSYRGVLFSGSVANFTPLTDMLVEAMLAASAAGGASMTMDEFLAKIKKDGTFADSVVAMAGKFRTAVLDALKALLLANGRTEDEVNAILAAVRGQNFDAVIFGLGSDLDKCLDNVGSLIENADGSVKAAILAAVKALGDLLPLPSSGATGSTGASTGASGN
ncbi:hypothetical protein [Variovorax sp. dw_954]|uniref:hypothetical protein n=1 Tax=Variovorax sp. dw_954 TaxID=2720078 RepID=UPI001BD34952|nr:hypothetical protein [Variovorax sp. dw_954]